MSEFLVLINDTLARLGLWLSFAVGLVARFGFFVWVVIRLSRRIRQASEGDPVQYEHYLGLRCFVTVFLAVLTVVMSLSTVHAGYLVQQGDIPIPGDGYRRYQPIAELLPFCATLLSGGLFLWSYFGWKKALCHKLLDQGKAFLKAKDFDTAFACFTQMIMQEWSKSEAYRLRAAVRKAKGIERHSGAVPDDLSGIVADLSHAIRHDPENADALADQAAMGGQNLVTAESDTRPPSNDADGSR